MTSILLSSTSPEVEARVAAAISVVSPATRFDRRPDLGAAFLELSSAAGLPDVLIMDGTADPGRAIELAAQVGEAHPTITIVLAAAEDAGVVLAALRAGVRDVVDPNSPELEPVLQQVLAGVRRRQSAFEADRQTERVRTGRVISVVSPKGGVGKTTVSTNVAIGLAAIAPESTVLVDLDVQFGDVASGLDLAPEYFLADAVSAQALRDPLVLKTFLTRHPSGLHVICAPDLPAEADAITGEVVGRLLDTLAAEFRFVIVDTAPGLGEHTLAALDRTTDLVLLTNMEIPGVRGLRKELDVLTELQLLPPSRQVVVNFTDKHGLLSIGDIEAVLGTSVDLRLPRSKAATAAVNEGIPVLKSHGRDSLAKALRTLVRRLSAAEQAADTVLPVAVPLLDSTLIRPEPPRSEPVESTPAEIEPADIEPAKSEPVESEPVGRKSIKPRHAASRWWRRRAAA